MEYKAKQAEGRDSEIQDLIRQQAADMAAEGNVNTEFANQLESASLSVDDQHLMMMRQHANWMINGVDDLQNYAMKVFGRNFARNAGGTSLDILPTGQLKPRVYNPKQQAFKGKHQRELSRSIRKNEEDLINAIEHA
ncbi:MAG: hypothetical protein QF577_04420, partial [Phycisphaerae bacterium]|nr:hypothetical protein [Phycisphaerae bacterium]